MNRPSRPGILPDCTNAAPPVTTPIPDTFINLPLRPADAASPRLRRRFGAPLRWLVARDAGDVAPTIDAAHAEAIAGRWCIGWVAYEAASAFDPVFVAGEHVHAANGVLAAFAVFDEAFDCVDAEHAAWTTDDWRVAPGAIDGISRLLPADLNSAGARSDLQLFSTVQSGYTNVLFNLQNPNTPFFQEKEVRQAVGTTHATDAPKSAQARA